MSAGFIATVLSMISSTGSIKPTPKTFFHSRLAITLVKRGFSGEVIQSAKDSQITGERLAEHRGGLDGVVRLRVGVLIIVRQLQHTLGSDCTLL
jgi:hypothetical protein